MFYLNWSSRLSRNIRLIWSFLIFFHRIDSWNICGRSTMKKKKKRGRGRVKWELRQTKRQHNLFCVIHLSSYPPLHTPIPAPLAVYCIVTGAPYQFWREGVGCVIWAAITLVVTNKKVQTHKWFENTHTLSLPLPQYTLSITHTHSGCKWGF